MNTDTLKKLSPYLAGFAIVSVLFFPSVSLSSSLPRIELVDLLIPILGIYLLIRRKEITDRSSIFILLGFSAYVVLTMAINGRLGQMRDYFEIFKLIKIALFIGLFSLSESLTTIRKLIRPIFVALVVVNFVHYFNLFHINEFLDDYFMGGGRYSIFGLDSAGHATHKRMIGLLGNPNDNAIVFMIFAIYFFPRKEYSLKSMGWLLAALVMMFLCQSRTALLALLPMLVVFAYMHRSQLRLLGLTIGTVCLAFGLAFTITKSTVNVGVPSKFTVHHEHPDSSYVDEQSTYLETVVGSELMKSESIQGRLETWKNLWGMIQQKPLFGHAPYKEYFYENELYAESEYILITWRYGFIGLLIYLLFLGHLLIKGMKNFHLEYGQKLSLLVILFLVVGLTNVPFGNKTILVLMAMTIGLFYAELKSHQKKNPSLTSTPSND